VLNKAIWILAAIFALTAGVTDARWRRIPNWLTYPAIPLAIFLHSIAGGWRGTRMSLLGAALGLGLLLPFVLVRSLGGGDWKLVGALGAFFGYETAVPFFQQRLIVILLWTLVINGVMALCLVIWKGRARQTLRNIGRMLAAFFRVHLPPSDLTIDNPEAIKVPFGVAAAVAVLLYTSSQPWGPF
jgi:prepilin peptidase CpaA